MIPRLPVESIPKLEEALAGFPKEVAEHVSDEWLEAIAKLRAKNAPPPT